MPFAASWAVVFWIVVRSYTVSSAYLRVALVAASTALVSRPAKLMVFLNLSVESLISTTAPLKFRSVSHRAVTPFNAAPPMKLPNAAALPVAFSNAFTASFALPVMRTDMMALCPAIVHLLFGSFHFLCQQAYAGAPVEFAGLVPPLPRGAAEAAGEDEAESAERIVGPRG